MLVVMAGAAKTMANPLQFATTGSGQRLHDDRKQLVRFAVRGQLAPHQGPDAQWGRLQTQCCAGVADLSRPTSAARSAEDAGADAPRC